MPAGFLLNTLDLRCPMSEPEYILISVAWPYANAEIHVGNITGSHLPGDIVARYHRLKGNHVLMVSGTDSHGTPGDPRAPTLRANRSRKSTSAITTASWICSSRSASPMTCSPPPIPPITSRSRRASSWPCSRTASSTPKPARSGTPRLRSASCPTATSKAPATSAASKARAPTSATTAATCSSRKS